jgi:hypothetical protein
LHRNPLEKKIVRDLVEYLKKVSPEILCLLKASGCIAVSGLSSLPFVEIDRWSELNQGATLQKPVSGAFA